MILDMILQHFCIWGKGNDKMHIALLFLLSTPGFTMGWNDFWRSILNKISRFKYLNISKCILTCPNIFKHIKIYMNISECIPAYQNVFEHIGMYLNLSECIRMFLNLSKPSWTYPINTLNIFQQGRENGLQDFQNLWIKNISQNIDRTFGHFFSEMVSTRCAIEAYESTRV